MNSLENRKQQGTKQSTLLKNSLEIMKIREITWLPQYSALSKSILTSFSETQIQQNLRFKNEFIRIIFQFPFGDYGDISNSIQNACVFSVPSGPPQNINCQSRSPNSLLLEWSKPKREERNGIIRGYWLEYYPRTLWYGEQQSYHKMMQFCALLHDWRRL